MDLNEQVQREELSFLDRSMDEDILSGVLLRGAGASPLSPPRKTYDPQRFSPDRRGNSYPGEAGAHAHKVESTSSSSNASSATSSATSLASSSTLSSMAADPSPIPGTQSGAPSFDAPQGDVPTEISSPRASLNPPTSHPAGKAGDAVADDLIDVVACIDDALGTAPNRIRSRWVSTARSPGRKRRGEKNGSEVTSSAHGQQDPPARAAPTWGRAPRPVGFSAASPLSTAPRGPAPSLMDLFGQDDTGDDASYAWATAEASASTLNPEALQSSSSSASCSSSCSEAEGVARRGVRRARAVAGDGDCGGGGGGGEDARKSPRRGIPSASVSSSIMDDDLRSILAEWRANKRRRSSTDSFDGVHAGAAASLSSSRSESALDPARGAREARAGSMRTASECGGPCPFDDAAADPFAPPRDTDERCMGVFEPVRGPQKLTPPRYCNDLHRGSPDPTAYTSSVDFFAGNGVRDAEYTEDASSLASVGLGVPAHIGPDSDPGDDPGDDPGEDGALSDRSSWPLRPGRDSPAMGRPSVGDGRASGATSPAVPHGEDHDWDQDQDYVFFSQVRRAPAHDIPWDPAAAAAGSGGSGGGQADDTLISGNGPATAGLVTPPRSVAQQGPGGPRAKLTVFVSSPPKASKTAALAVLESGRGGGQAPSPGEPQPHVPLSADQGCASDAAAPAAPVEHVEHVTTRDRHLAPRVSRRSAFSPPLSPVQGLSRRGAAGAPLSPIPASRAAGSPRASAPRIVHFGSQHLAGHMGVNLCPISFATAARAFSGAQHSFPTSPSGSSSLCASPGPGTSPCPGTGRPFADLLADTVAGLFTLGPFSSDEASARRGSDPRRPAAATATAMNAPAMNAPAMNAPAVMAAPLSASPSTPQLHSVEPHHPASPPRSPPSQPAHAPAPLSMASVVAGADLTRSYPYPADPSCRDEDDNDPAEHGQGEGGGRAAGEGPECVLIPAGREVAGLLGLSDTSMDAGSDEAGDDDESSSSSCRSMRRVPALESADDTVTLTPVGATAGVRDGSGRVEKGAAPSKGLTFGSPGPGGLGTAQVIVVAAATSTTTTAAAAPAAADKPGSRLLRSRVDDVLRSDSDVSVLPETLSDGGEGDHDYRNCSSAAAAPAAMSSSPKIAHARISGGDSDASGASFDSDEFDDDPVVQILKSRLRECEQRLGSSEAPAPSAAASSPGFGN